MSGSDGLKVRPYTLRTGDTLESISKKRAMTVDDVLKMNPDISLNVVEGQTILLPSGKLSVRDREILDGIGPGFRVYPVRGTERMEDIMSKRGITLPEVQALNPGVDLQKLTDHQLIKLPSDKFTVREREMLTGIVPVEFFTPEKQPFVIGIGGLLLVCLAVLVWQRTYKEEDADRDDAEEASRNKGP
ncbi:MAG: hypothetical protein WDW38_003622 [Sanguina aurantia]